MNIESALRSIGQRVNLGPVKIGRIFPRKEGQSQYGPYSFEAMKVTDGTGEMEVKLKNIAPASTLDLLEGRYVTFEHVEIKPEIFQGESKIKAIADSRSDFALGEIAAGGHSEASIPQPSGNGDIKERIFNAAARWNLAKEAFCEASGIPLMPDTPMTTWSVFTSTINSIYIEANRR